MKVLSLLQIFLASVLLLATSVAAFQPTTGNTVRQTLALFASTQVEEEVVNQQRRALLLSAASASLAAFVPLSALADDQEKDASTSTTVLHIVDYPKSGSCGQANVPSNGVFFAKKFGGLVDGSCATEGFSVAEGTANGIKEKDQQRTYEIYGKE